MGKIWITDEIAIDESEVQLDFVRASGPGGQNVNKVASKVQLRFNVSSGALPGEVRTRLAHFASGFITQDGTLLIEAQRYRSQEQNRQDALRRLVSLLRQAAQKPKLRKKTQPTAASRQRRLAEKRRRGQIKQLRQTGGDREF
jgi:ribosome-associated protein